MLANARGHRREGEQREPTVRCTALFGRARIVRLPLRISVDPLILCQSKPVDLKVEVMHGG
jgi:hypothetical protein